MARKHQRGKRQLFTGRPRRATVLSVSNFFYDEYRPFTIIPRIPRPKRGTAPLITAGALIALGGALIFVFSR
jgi:hypothetical protein